MHSAMWTLQITDFFVLALCHSPLVLRISICVTNNKQRVAFCFYRKTSEPFIGFAPMQYLGKSWRSTVLKLFNLTLNPHLPQNSNSKFWSSLRIQLPGFKLPCFSMMIEQLNAKLWWHGCQLCLGQLSGDGEYSQSMNKAYSLLIYYNTNLNFIIKLLSSLEISTFIQFRKFGFQLKC